MQQKIISLYELDALKSLDEAFLNELKCIDFDTYQSLLKARSNELTTQQQDALLIELSWHLEDFISRYFEVQNDVTSLAKNINTLALVFTVKRQFVQRKAAKSFTIDDEPKVQQALKAFAEIGLDVFDDLQFARQINSWIDQNNVDYLEHARIYTGYAVATFEGRQKHKASILLKTPNKIDNAHLVHNATYLDSKFVDVNAVARTGFSCTTSPINVLEALDNAHYCIYCHNQGKDSCSKGMKTSDNGFKVNELGNKLTGCPLEEKISQMNQVRSQGSIIGALAIIAIDNPLCAGTGNRICNDCVKACIYQKQDPVNIPLVETQVLQDVLSLQYGFEIYALLSRWNPLNFRSPLPLADNKKKVLVCGLGPAGYTAAYYLLRSGFCVVAIDGLKIEPVEGNGINQFGVRQKILPIKDWQSYIQDLAKRPGYGFGGVAEYGITVRWDKNYLQAIRAILERNSNFAMFGSTRFGSNITYDDAKELGFDHIVLACGAGKPNLLNIKNVFAKGVRTASDFLMSLQSAGAFLEDNIVNFDMQLPVCVIGGGLTAIDAATESLAYYQVMVKRFKNFYESLKDPNAFLDSLANSDKQKALMYLSHAKQLDDAISPQAKLQLLKAWGGVKVLYRGALINAPCYRLNHEEVEKALIEGIEFVENITPIEFSTANDGSVIGIVHKNGIVDAKTILLAIGTAPNLAVKSDIPDIIEIADNYFIALDKNGNVIANDRISKPTSSSVILVPHQAQGISISYIGDLHPSYFGNVVKAMASAKNGMKQVEDMLLEHEPNNIEDNRSFLLKMYDLLVASIESVHHINDDIIELVVKSKLAAKNFKPGQFYRLQNFYNNAKTIEVNNTHIKLAIEPLALTGASVDKAKGCLNLIILKSGASSIICEHLAPGELVALMGPTGAPTEIVANQTIMLVGGGLGNAVLFSIGQALKAAGSKVLYFAGYKKLKDRYKVEEIEAAADQVVWCSDEGMLSVNRENDSAFWGNIVEAIKYYAHHNIKGIKLQDVDRLIVIGSDRMMAAVAHARHNSLSALFKPSCVAIASVNSPMQCMMKEICGQCIQRHVIDGKEVYLYSCANQDQNLDSVDFKCLNERLSQNIVHEQLVKRLLS